MGPLALLLLLALLQGLTEFLPVSSSGHLVLARELLPGGDSLPDDASIEVLLHLGTLLAVLLFYRREILALLLGLLGRGSEAGAQRRLLGLLILATLPAAAVGLGLEDRIEQAFSTPMVAAVCLLVTGTGLWWSRRLPGGAVSLTTLGVGAALLIGLAQAAAILPGISRSGATIVTGLALGLSIDAAAAFSFLLSIPAILGAAVLKLPDLAAAEPGAGAPDPTALLLAGATAFLVGFLALAMLLWLLRARRLSWFAPYCWLLGLVGLAAGLTA
ncbi:MAG: undecaprenyl-diphosphate phosphatase [Planctomycetota bacterium]|nr:MAG: undecaprenyl-diphosphate phosphatase [Planctomycetota bacterium]